jgi:hypothetical protein
MININDFNLYFMYISQFDTWGNDYGKNQGKDSRGNTTPPEVRHCQQQLSQADSLPGYQAGYQAGFQVGFQEGFQEGSQAGSPVPAGCNVDLQW